MDVVRDATFLFGAIRARGNPNIDAFSWDLLEFREFRIILKNPVFSHSRT